MDTDVLRYPGAAVENVKKDQTIFLDGEIGMHMYIVLKGQVQITIAGRIVDTINPGGIFGELALIDGGARAGSAIAATDGALLSIDEHQFTTLVRESPEFAIKLLRTIVTRVRLADRLGGITR
jgi:CRP/FNR family cyclic AMP-dependent transcriptional regulator